MLIYTIAESRVVEHKAVTRAQVNTGVALLLTSQATVAGAFLLLLDSMVIAPLAIVRPPLAAVLRPVSTTATHLQRDGEANWPRPGPLSGWTPAR